MAAEKDGRRPPLQKLSVKEHRPNSQKPTSPSSDLHDAEVEPLIAALKQLGDDMLDEPVPEKLLKTLKKQGSSKS